MLTRYFVHRRTANRYPASISIAANAQTYGNPIRYWVAGDGALLNDILAALARAAGLDRIVPSLGNQCITYTGNNLTINPALLTAAIIGNPSKVYDGTTAASLTVSNFSLSGFAAGEGASIGQIVGSYNSKNVVTASTVNASLQATDFTATGGTLLSNYILPTTATGTGNITPAMLSVSGITASNKVYDGSTNAAINTAGATYTGIVAGDIVTIGSVSGAFADKNVGLGKAVTISASITGADAGNYLISTQAATSADITAKALSVSGLVADNKIYDGTVNASINAAGAIYNGIVAGDIVSVGSASGCLRTRMWVSEM
jgi:hypothetical protein